MSDMEREIPQPPRTAAGPPGAGEGDGLDAARASAEQLLQAADEAIARALSDDSERFLQATRQSGGQ